MAALIVCVFLSPIILIVLYSIYAQPPAGMNIDYKTCHDIWTDKIGKELFSLNNCTMEKVQVGRSSVIGSAYDEPVKYIKKYVLDKMPVKDAEILLTRIENYNATMPKLKAASIESYNACMKALFDKWENNKKSKYFRPFYDDWEDINDKFDDYFSFIFFSVSKTGITAKTIIVNDIVLNNLKQLYKPNSIKASSNKVQKDGNATEAFIKEQRNIMNRIYDEGLTLRNWILKRDNYTCQCCGNSIANEPNLLLEVDHIHPVSKWGPSTPENLQTLCWKCNREKSDK